MWIGTGNLFCSQITTKKADDCTCVKVNIQKISFEKLGRIASIYSQKEGLIWILSGKLNLNSKGWFYWAFRVLFRIYENLCIELLLTPSLYLSENCFYICLNKNKKKHGYKNDNFTTTQILIRSIRKHCLWIIFQAFLYIGRLFLCPLIKFSRI